MDLTPYLDDLESRIDPAEEKVLLGEWIGFLEGRFRGEVFSPRRPEARPPRIEWPRVTINEALSDFDCMALQQMANASGEISTASGMFMTVRANYGTSILASLFGVPVAIMDEKLNLLPTARPFPGGKDDIRKAVDRGVPDLEAGQGGQVLEVGMRFNEIMEPYPKIRDHVHLYHPDLQGPMDICELLWGSDLFLDLLDEPELVKTLLDLITETYEAFLRRWYEICSPPEGPYSYHWGTLQKGNVMLRDDSAMNLSPAMFEEFIEPYDRRLLEAFGGGGIHFCGRGDHYIDRASAIPGMHAIYMSQPAYNDMETIYRHTVDRGIVLGNFPRETAEEALRNGRDLRGRVQCRMSAHRDTAAHAAANAERKAVPA